MRAGDAEHLLCDAAFTLQRRRSHLPSRACVIARNTEDLVDGLAAIRDGREDERVVRGDAAGPLATAWVFTGMGPQRAAMGRELFANAPAFRAEIEACDAIFAPLAGWSIVDVMLSLDDDAKARRNDVAQVMNFAVQAGLAAMLRALGVVPDAIVGHSVGEIAAAYAAGALTREDAVRVIFHRSIATQRLAGLGTMLAAGVSEADARWLFGPDDDVAVAAINSPTAVSLAGKRADLERISDQLQAIGHFARLVPVEVAYHSAHLEPVREELLGAWANVAPRAARCALYSTVHGGRVEGVSHDAAYWWSNARQPVLFSAAIDAMIRDGIRHFVEVGPHPVLAPYLRELFAASGARASCAHTLKRGVGERSSVLRCVAEVHCRGATIDWTAASITASGAMLQMPTYPWQRRRHWTETRAMREERLATDLVHPLLNERIDGPSPGWTTWLDQSALAFLWDHQVQRTPIAPGALYVELFAALARQRA
jgi:acyl transferase domain-containing protein